MTSSNCSDVKRLMVPRNGSKGARRKKKEVQGDESSLGSDGFENETRG